MPGHSARKPLAARHREARSIAHAPTADLAAGLRWAALIAIVLTTIWSYWPTLVDLMKEWQRDEDYSVGQLVPLAALWLLWHDRARLKTCVIRPCWWGMLVILLAQGARAFGLVQLFQSAERYSFVLTVAGVVLLVAGWQVFRRVAWILLFLFLMVPLPGRVHNMISGPLQDLATVGAVVTLELFGTAVAREGHVMVLNDNVPVAVAEACSGLRMLTAFIVVAATLAYVVNRPRWQKAVVLLSSIPVAIVCNLIRLVVTAWLFLVVSGEVAERFFHDFAGWTMMPLAVVLLVAELWIMSRLVVEDAKR
ncbi:MAG: exosortase/archaeosortase family protein [Phycisphaerae bacterium]|nr:exosortase/archaeosortase family protein [Phycisphaerae bacterium]